METFDPNRDLYRCTVFDYRPRVDRRPPGPTCGSPTGFDVMDTILQRCEAKGLRMTEQRRVIAEVLQNSTDHPDVAVMYGPSELTTTWKGSKVVIEQVTNYPLSDAVGKAVLV